MRIAVVDGQGGGIGKAVVEKLRLTFGTTVEILALGTNTSAAALMLKAGANKAATGENPIVVNASKVDVIVGSVAILAADSMLGEMTPQMAKAIAQSAAKKLLIPLNRCNIEIVGIKPVPLPFLLDEAVETIREMML
jgi:NAD(P)-dependent dehydrogenase (short-subunit alcohol dehydrogenase family)